MRFFLLAGAALVAAPLSAQDHSGQDHAAHGAQPPAEMDHCAMGHLPPEQCPPKEQPQDDHSAHGQMDHSGHGGSEPAAEPPMGHSQHQGMDHASHGADDPPAEPAMDHSQHGAMNHSGHAMPMDKDAPGAAPESAVPARAFEGPRHAADAIWGEQAMAPARATLARENGAMNTGVVLIERLEARVPADGGETGYLWDAQASYGGDAHRFVLKTEGEGEFAGTLEEAEVQALYSRAIGPFFDVQAGVRLDVEPDTAGHLVLGLAGLAPYMFHVDAAAFLSDRGDLTARIEAEYDQKITQHLILQPRIEAEFAAQDIAERGIGSGLTKVEPGLRLRYEIAREFAPYVGVEYEAKVGRTADFARAAGEDPDGVKLLAGVRAWF